MTKLRTLKDLEINSAYAEIDEKIIQSKKIRQEAIKWIKKDFNKEIKEYFGGFKDFKRLSSHSVWSYIKTNMKEWIKWIKFFNIIGKDLK